MYSVTAYYNTGYNAINLPYSPEILEGITTKISLSAIDVVQGKCFSRVKVKFPISSNPDSVDYIKVSKEGDISDTAYYSVMGFSKKAADVVEFACVEDFITELGGIPRLKLSDGIIVRQSISEEENVWDAEVIEDELLGCNRPLNLTVDKLPYDQPTGEAQFVDATVDLSAARISYVRLDDSGSGGTSAQASLVPTMQDASSVRTTNYKMSVLDDIEDISNVNTVDVNLPNVSGGEVFEYSETNVPSRIADARSLRMENGILHQYAIPYKFVTKNLSSGIMRIDGKCTIYNVSNNKFRFEPNTGSGYYKRIYQGHNCRYGLYTCAGNRIEFNPEDIRKESELSPVFYSLVDPRPDGRPYYQPRFFHKQGNPPLLNAVEGAKWQRLPLKFTEVSGGEILTQQFKNTSRLEGRQHMGVQNQLENASAMARLNQSFGFIGGTANLIGSAVKSAGGFLVGLDSPMSGGALAAEAGRAGGGIISQSMSYLHSQMLAQSITNAAEMAETNSFGVYELQRAKELYDFGVQTQTVSPEVYLPADTNLTRDLYENDCLIYRYMPSDEDLAYHTKILNAYGVKCFKPVSEINPHNGARFYYVQIQGAKVCENISFGTPSLRQVEGASAQLVAGCRFWKVANLSHNNSFGGLNIGTFDPLS